MSCMHGSQGLIQAPEIENGYVVKYNRSVNLYLNRICKRLIFLFVFAANRRKKGNHVFLVAFYECDDDFQIENPESDRLYCSKKQWIGEHPVCFSTGSDDEDEDEEGEEEEGEEEEGEEEDEDGDGDGEEGMY